MEQALLGGGCFWCTEELSKEYMVLSRRYPLMQEAMTLTRYEPVCSGTTGHAEIVEVKFDPELVSFETLLEVFFTVHDPTQLNRQGNDVGTQYRSCIMPTTEQQALTAKIVIERMQTYYDSPIVTTIEEPTHFTIAEEYHHDYYARNPGQGYCMAVVGPKINKVRAKHAHLYTA